MESSTRSSRLGRAPGGHRSGVAAVLAGVTALALATPASAQTTTVVAGPSPYTYQNPDVTIDRGDALDFQNLDFSAPHDVTSLDADARGNSLFRSETIDAPDTVPVEGAESAPPGSYDFICSVHPFMTGTLTVRGEGGGGAGAGSFAFRVRALDRRIGKVLAAGELRVRVNAGEAAKLRLRASERGAGKAVASGAASLRKGTSRVAAELTRAGRRLLKQARKAGEKVRLTLNARARDAAGNTAARTVELTLR